MTIWEDDQGVAACNGKKALVTVPEGAQAGELLGMEPCMCELSEASLANFGDALRHAVELISDRIRYPEGR